MMVGSYVLDPLVPPALLYSIGSYEYVFEQRGGEVCDYRSCSPPPHAAGLIKVHPEANPISRLSHTGKLRDSACTKMQD